MPDGGFKIFRVAFLYEEMELVAAVFGKIVIFLCLSQIRPVINEFKLLPCGRSVSCELLNFEQNLINFLKVINYLDF